MVTIITLVDLSWLLQTNQGLCQILEVFWRGDLVIKLFFKSSFLYGRWIMIYQSDSLER